MLDKGPQEVAQSAGITLIKVEVTSSNPPPPLVWTCQKNHARQGVRVT
jgi:hypothetical protein